MTKHAKELNTATRRLLAQCFHELDLLTNNPNNHTAAERLADYTEAAWTTARQIINNQDR